MAFIIRANSDVKQEKGSAKDLLALAGGQAGTVSGALEAGD